VTTFIFFLFHFGAMSEKWEFRPRALVTYALSTPVQVILKHIASPDEPVTGDPTKVSLPVPAPINWERLDNWTRFLSLRNEENQRSEWRYCKFVHDEAGKAPWNDTISYYLDWNQIGNKFQRPSKGQRQPKKPVEIASLEKAAESFDKANMKGRIEPHHSNIKRSLAQLTSIYKV